MKKAGICRLIIVVCVTSLLFTFGLLVGCDTGNTSKTAEVTFDQLLANPAKYAGRQISIEGFYYQGFETIVLSEQLDYSGFAQGHLIPKGDMIWIEGGIPLEIYEKLYQQNMMGPLEHYGKLKIKGKFEYGAKYGHLGGYDFQIVPLDVRIIPWAPP